MWTDIDINANQLKYDTGRSSLIKLPSREDRVWISNKCIRSGKHSAALSVGINTEFTYHLVRGKTIKYDMSGESLIELFDTIEIVAPREKATTSYEHTPKKIGAKKIEPDSDLIK